MYEKDTWCGKIGNDYLTDIPGSRVKALISDNTSGGVATNPLWFDELVIQFPLLYGQLTPFVDLRDVPRGTLIQTASIGNPTVQWGIPEGTGYSPFNTDALVAQFPRRFTRLALPWKSAATC